MYNDARKPLPYYLNHQQLPPFTPSSNTTSTSSMITQQQPLSMMRLDTSQQSIAKTDPKSKVHESLGTGIRCQRCATYKLDCDLQRPCQRCREALVRRCVSEERPPESLNDLSVTTSLPIASFAQALETFAPIEARTSATTLQPRPDHTPSRTTVSTIQRAQKSSQGTPEALGPPPLASRFVENNSFLLPQYQDLPQISSFNDVANGLKVAIPRVKARERK